MERVMAEHPLEDRDAERRGLLAVPSPRFVRACDGQVDVGKRVWQRLADDVRAWWWIADLLEQRDHARDLAGFALAAHKMPADLAVDAVGVFHDRRAAVIVDGPR